MLNISGGKHSHLYGHSNSVVGAQSGFFGDKPAIFDNRPDGIFVEIVFGSGVFFADHIHMTLQHQERSVFFSGSGRFANEDIAHFVDQGFEFQAFAKCFQMSNYFFFFARRTGYLKNLIKISPTGLGWRFWISVFIFLRLIILIRNYYTKIHREDTEIHKEI